MLPVLPTAEHRVPLAEPSHLDYQPDPDDNTAPPPKGAPEGGFKGSHVNDCLRHLMAVVRRLGDRVTALANQAPPELPDPTEGLGTMALQSHAAVNITGGRVATPGTRRVPGADVRLFWGTTAEAEAEAAWGWYICDGRTWRRRDGTIGGATPDWRDRFPCFAGAAAPKSLGGSLGKTTSEAGGHSHAGTTAAAGGHGHTVASGGGFTPSGSIAEAGRHNHYGNTLPVSLTIAQLPFNYSGHNNVTKGGDYKVWFMPPLSENTLRAADWHQHTISWDGEHTHGLTLSPVPAHSHGLSTVGDHSHGLTTAAVGDHAHAIADARPPFVALIPLLFCWE